MSKHTPELWKVDTSSFYPGGCKRVLVRDASGYGIAQANLRDDRRVDEASSEMFATAQLIAAAPDLLEACKRALVGFKNTPPVLGEDRYEPILALTAAIAKAEGK